MTEGRRILVVDGEAALRDEMRADLELHGYIVQAADGADVGPKMRAALPDLVVLDVMMLVNDDIHPVETFTVDRTVPAAKAAEYDALVLPGGAVNPDRLRVNKDAMQFVRDFFAAGKPVGAICHGPWSLVETGIVVGRTVASWPSLQTDIRNAGGAWVDEEVHSENGLVTSRRPADLPAFCPKIVEVFRAGTPAASAR